MLRWVILVLSVLHCDVTSAAGRRNRLGGSASIGFILIVVTTLDDCGHFDTFGISVYCRLKVICHPFCRSYCHLNVSGQMDGSKLNELTE